MGIFLLVVIQRRRGSAVKHQRHCDPTIYSEYLHFNWHLCVRRCCRPVCCCPGATVSNSANTEPSDLFCTLCVFLLLSFDRFWFMFTFIFVLLYFCAFVSILPYSFSLMVSFFWFGQGLVMCSPLKHCSQSWLECIMSTCEMKYLKKIFSNYCLGVFKDLPYVNKLNHPWHTSWFLKGEMKRQKWNTVGKKTYIYH